MRKQCTMVARCYDGRSECHTIWSKYCLWTREVRALLQSSVSRCKNRFDVDSMAAAARQRTTFSEKFRMKRGTFRRKAALNMNPCMHDQTSAPKAAQILSGKSTCCFDKHTHSTHAYLHPRESVGKCSADDRQPQQEEDALASNGQQVIEYFLESIA